MGKYKHGKPNEETDLEEFKQRLSKVKLKKRQRAYLILLYWLGCRRSEPLVLRKQDIEEHQGSLFISIHFRKNDSI